MHTYFECHVHGQYENRVYLNHDFWDYLHSRKSGQN